MKIGILAVQGAFAEHKSKLEKLGVKLSVIARGISVGDELEYADEVTLGRSIVNRTVFTGTI